MGTEPDSMPTRQTRYRSFGLPRARRITDHFIRPLGIVVRFLWKSAEKHEVTVPKPCQRSFGRSVTDGKQMVGATGLEPVTSCV